MWINNMAPCGFVVVVLSIIAHAYADCPNGFEHVANSCYKVEALESSWVEAKMFCRVLGSELVVIETAEEETRIEGILSRVHGSHIDEIYWLAGADITNEKDWRWFMADGVSTPITYTNWATNRPDNAGGNENCLVLQYNRGKTFWNDVGCYARHSFICETTYDGQAEIVG